jgi:hypothetical protein
MPGISSDTRTQQGRRTPLRLLFGAAVTGLAAFVGTFLVEGAVRPGYRPWRHAVSQLSLGPFGWVNTIAILVAAAALLAFAVGLGRAVPGRHRLDLGAPPHGRGRGLLRVAGHLSRRPRAGIPARQPRPAEPARARPRPGRHGHLRVSERRLLRHGATLRRRPGRARLGPLLARHRPGGGDRVRDDRGAHRTGRRRRAAQRTGRSRPAGHDHHRLRLGRPARPSTEEMES